MWSWRSSASIGVMTLGLFIAEPRYAIAQQSVISNRGVVEIETAGSLGISVRIVEDLANMIDDGATRRVIPVVGKGALQNLADLRHQTPQRRASYFNSRRDRRRPRSCERTYKSRCSLECYCCHNRTRVQAS